MSCFDRTLGHLQLPSRPHTTPEWIYFPSMPAWRRSPPMLPLNIRTRPDERHFKHADVCSGCFEHRSLGGPGWRETSHRFQFAATLLAFRADDKEMNDPRVLSHSLNVEFSRYPSNHCPAVHLFFFFVVFFSYCMLESHFSHFSSFTSCFQWDSVLFALLPHESSSHPFLYLSISLSHSFFHCTWSNTRALLNSVWIMFDPDVFLPPVRCETHVPQSSRTIMSVIVFLQCIFLITICRFLAVLSSLRRQISQVCSRFAWWAFNTLLLLTFFVLILFLFGIMPFKNRGIFSGFWHGCCSVVRVWCPISVTDMTPQIIRLVQECVLLFFLSNGIIKQEHHRQ